MIHLCKSPISIPYIPNQPELGGRFSEINLTAKVQQFFRLLEVNLKVFRTGKQSNNFNLSGRRGMTVFSQVRLLCDLSGPLSAGGLSSILSRKVDLTRKHLQSSDNWLFVRIKLGKSPLSL